MKELNPRTLAMTVFLAAVALYAMSAVNGFAYDDHMVIRGDERIHDLSRIGQLFTMPYWNDPGLGLYRPLASLTFALDWAVSGDSATWFHVVNILWNAAACTLVFLVLLTLAPLPAALAGTALFAAHPVHVEAVANVVGRAEVMAACFVLGAMLVWLRTAPAVAIEGRRRAALLLLFGLALLSKESAIMLPALLALMDVARGALTPSSLRDWLRVHRVTLLLLVATALAYLIARTAVLGSLGPPMVDPALDIARSTPARIWTALQGWPHVLRLLVYPRTLLSDYGPRIILPALSPSPQSLLGGVILAGLVAGGLYAWARGAGRAAAALLFIPVAMLPTSNLIVPIGVIVAERTLYLPSFALALGAAFAIASMKSEAPRRAAFALVAIATILFTARTLQRIPVWKSTDTVFAALAADRPDSFRNAWYAARAAAETRQPALALERYGDALQMWPYRHGLVLEAAAYAAQVGDGEYAGRLSTFALERWPDDVRFLRMNAGVLLDRPDTVAAREAIERALLVAPDDSILLKMRRAVTPMQVP